MAYVSKETKAKIAANLKKVMPDGWKYSLRVHDHSSITLTISQAPVDLIAMVNEKRAEEAMRKGRPVETIRDGYVQLNKFYLQDSLKDEALEIIRKANEALHDKEYYFDHSETQTDFFNCAYYVNIQIGRWDKPFAIKAGN